MVDKIENALNESRILVLVAQVILGFQYQAFFQPGFDRLPASSQHAKMVGFGLMLPALALLISPAAYHRIVMKGHVGQEFQRFISRVSMAALLPFAVGIAADFYVVGVKLGSRPTGIASGVLAGLTALFFWYGLEAIVVCKQRRAVSHAKEVAMPDVPTPLSDRIKFVLTEVRVVLPGAQALLGFQFAAVLTESFDKLPAPAKTIHFASLANVALATILLMAPAAFHRIVEAGEDTERLHNFASRMVLGALALLAPGICGDVFVVVVKAFHSMAWATVASGVSLLTFYGWWFAYMLYRRAARQNSTLNRNAAAMSGTPQP